MTEGTSWEVVEAGFEPSSSDKYSHSIIGKEVTGFLSDPFLIQECIFANIIISTIGQNPGLILPPSCLLSFLNKI